MAFWVRVDIEATGKVQAITYRDNVSGNPLTSTYIHKAEANTVSQALRTLAKILAKHAPTNV